jgi:hypothetical protein
MAMQSDDPPPEASKAVSLSDAHRTQKDPKLWAKYRATNERLKREGRRTYTGTPPNVRYVPSEFDGIGHQLRQSLRDLRASIEEDLFTKLMRGDLTAWAREGSPLAPWREIPASAWKALQIDNLTKGTAKGPGVALFDVRVGPRVVIVATPNVVRVPPQPATGAPGRPSNMHWIEAEFSRRIEAGQLVEKTREQAAALAAWFKAAHPDKQCPTEKTIANKIRLKHRKNRPCPK